MKSNQPRWGSVVRQAVVLCVAAFLFLLPSLTYLDQRVPLWMGGIWDDVAFDAVVVLVKSPEVPCVLGQPVSVPLEPCPHAPPPAPVWRPIALPLRWPETRAPP